MNSSSRTIERVGVTFDDPTLVADAGLIVPATLMVRLGLEALVNQMVRLGGRVGGARPGRKVLTLVAAILAGATHIDHADRLRAGATHRVLPFRVMAPSTLGTFLRAFTFGHIRQLDKVIAETIRRAWSLGAGPDADQMVIDLDSTICEVHGKLKQGAAYGYTHVLGYHPLSRCGPRPVRSSMPGCARDLPNAATSDSSKSSSPGCAGPGPPARSSCGPTPASGPGRSSTPCVAPGVAVVHHGHDQRPDQRPASRPSTSPPGSPLPIPTAARPRWPRPSYVASGQGRASAPCAWSCAAPGSADAPSERCGPIGVTTPSSPTSICPRRMRPLPPRARHRRTGHP